MESNKKAKRSLEGLWWLFTLLIVIGVLSPLLVQQIAFPYYLSNAIFVIALVTYTRYTFLLQHTFLAKHQVLKVVLVFLAIPIVFLLIQEINLFQSYLDNYGYEAFLGHLPLQKRTGMESYIYNEMLFFGVASAIAATIFPFRLIFSLWRQRNTGSV